MCDNSALREAIAELQSYVAKAPASDPGEGYWAHIDAAFACGVRKETARAADVMRKALTALGVTPNPGLAVCPHCGGCKASDEHFVDCRAPAGDDSEDD